jgi:hypothetical protein
MMKKEDNFLLYVCLAVSCFEVKVCICWSVVGGV